MKIVILKGSFKKLESSTHCLVITFEELKEWVRRGAILGHLFRYQEAQLLSYSIKTISRPFLTALLLRLLSQRACYFKDEEGGCQKITIWILAKLWWRLVKDFVQKSTLIRQVQNEIEYLGSEVIQQNKKELNLSAIPVYLRTDLSFGICAGGSVSHIAGVLNHLDKFCRKPIFLTTDRIPTVRNDIETHIVLPKNLYWDFKELPTLYFNKTFEQNVRRVLSDRKISFIYQRYSINNYSGVKLANIYRIPFVLEYNGSEIWMNRYWGRPLKYESLSEKIELLNLKSADVVVVVSQAMKDELVVRGIEADKILVNPNGVDTERYKPDIDSSHIRKKYGLDEKIVVGFIGTFGPWHGADILAKAVKPVVESNPNIHFLFIGDGVMMSYVKRIVEKDMTEKYVTFTSIVPQEEAPKYLAACDILASPHVPNPDGTPFFGSPTKLFEYMAMGKPIVASNLDQIGEVLEHGKTAWMVKPGDVASLANGIKHLTDNPDICIILGNNAKKEVVSKYTWQEHTRKIVEKLKEMVK